MGGREIAFIVLVVLGGILTLSAEISLFMFICFKPKKNGLWFRNSMNKYLVASVIYLAVALALALAFALAPGGKNVTLSLAVAFGILGFTYLFEALACALRYKNFITED
jgi:hypothetical protein